MTKNDFIELLNTRNKQLNLDISNSNDSPSKEIHETEDDIPAWIRQLQAEMGYNPEKEIDSDDDYEDSDDVPNTYGEIATAIEKNGLAQIQYKLSHLTSQQTDLVGQLNELRAQLNKFDAEDYAYQNNEQYFKSLGLARNLYSQLNNVKARIKAAKDEENKTCLEIAFDQALENKIITTSDEAVDFWDNPATYLKTLHDNDLLSPTVDNYFFNS